jgi:Fe(II)/alpha-ketoglutarate-dependent arginine beta-hydroxylase
MLLVLLGSALGECLAWATQQDGYLVHDILPIRGNEHEQLGTGSEELLCWHTEDAFHPYRGDYVGMLCLRNPDLVPTTIGTLRDGQLSREQIRELFRPQYKIRPDESHLLKNRGDGEVAEESLASAYGRMEGRNREPKPIAVLYGSEESPYLRLDPYFMEDLPENGPAHRAFSALVRTLEENLEDMVLRPGDYCFIDNLKAVHGRKPFKARYDGRDRWLKRVIVTRDLRRSREARTAAGSRVIY